MCVLFWDFFVSLCVIIRVFFFRLNVNACFSAFSSIQLHTPKFRAAILWFDQASLVALNLRKNIVLVDFFSPKFSNFLAF